MTKIKLPSKELNNINVFISIQSLETYLEIIKSGMEQSKIQKKVQLRESSSLIETEKDLHEFMTEEEIFSLEHINYFKENLNCSQIANLASYSLVPICYMLFETTLVEFAKIAENHFSINIKHNELLGGKIEKIKKYLHKFADIKVSDYKSWSTLKDLEVIRNCIIHNDGIVNELFKESNKIRLLPQKYQSDLFISKPFHSDNEVVVIKFSLCGIFIKNLHEFFDDLIKDFGFHKDFYFGSKASQCFLDERIRAKVEYDEAVKKAKEIYNKRLGI